MEDTKEKKTTKTAKTPKKAKDKKPKTEQNPEQMSFVDLVKAAQSDIGYLEEAKKHLKDNFLFQIQVYIKTTIKRALQKSVVVELPVVCDLVFTSEDEARSYILYFLNQVSKEMFNGYPLVVPDPTDSKKVNINDKFVKVVVKPLTLVQAFQDR